MESLAAPELPIRREARFHQLTHQLFDVLVIGGGITGAGIAWQLARWGVKVALVEQGDYASGTSSRSSKLIHGGFRYLPHGEIRLVRQVAQERTRLARLMPHLVSPLRMTIPVYKDGPYPLPLLSLGTWVYDHLGPVDSHHQPTRRTADEIVSRVPHLTARHLRGAVDYYEFWGHDARITWAVIATAAHLGAITLNYVRAEFSPSHFPPSRPCEIAIVDQRTGNTGMVSARVVVNAVGPWASDWTSEAQLVKSRGIHLAFPYGRIPIPNAIVLKTPDHANVFAVPHGPATYIGTTDKRDASAPESPSLPFDDVQYLLDAANNTFSSLNLIPADIIAAWSGVRPLIAQDAHARTDQLSRRDKVLVNGSLITVLGGKFTGFRATAQAVAEKVLTRLGGTTFTPTSEYILGAPNIIDPMGTMRNIAQSHKIPEDWMAHMWERYGTYSDQLWATAKPEALAPVVDGIPLLLAEIDWAVQHEQALTVADILIRRTGLAWLEGLNLIQLDALAKGTSERMATLLGWTGNERDRQIHDFNNVSYVDQVRHWHKVGS